MVFNEKIKKGGIYIKKKQQKIFSNFITKEKELSDIEKDHAQKTIQYMAYCLEDEMNNMSLKKKAFTYIYDFFSSFIISYKGKKHKKEISYLTVKDKEDKLIKNTTFKDDDFTIHLELKRYFNKKTEIYDCGGIDVSNIEYMVYIFIEYEEMKTENYYENSFSNLADAKNYYSNIYDKIKDVSVINLFGTLINDMNIRIDELKDRIKFIDSKSKKFMNN